jgi:glutaryl-CoA transferase
VLAGLLARERSGGAAGRGQRIDVSLLGSTLALLINQAQNAFVSGRSPGRRGNAHPNIVPYETFATADGEIAVAVGSERQWPRFCEALGVPELATDPRFATNGDRVGHREALRPLLAERFAGRSSSEWIAALEAADVPSGTINDVLAAFATPAARAGRMRVAVTHPKLGAVDQVGPPFVLSRTPARVRTAPPLLGEDSDAILGEVGYSAEEIARLRGSGVI